MKPSPRAARRETREHGGGEVVILLPDPHVLRLIARSVLLAAAIISFPWIRTALFVGGCGWPMPPPASSPSLHESYPKWVDSPFALRMLLADLRREGLFCAELRNVFLGDPGARAQFLKNNRIDLMSPEYKKLMVGDDSVDFVLAADGLGDSALAFVDRVLKVGGIVTVRLGSDPSKSFFRLPPNYRMAYIRRFESTIVAIKKISHGNVSGRRLLSTTKVIEDEEEEEPTAGAKKAEVALMEENYWFGLQ